VIGDKAGPYAKLGAIEFELATRRGMPAICGAVELKASLIVVARREAPRRNRSLAFAIKAPVVGDPGRRGAQPRRSDAFTIGKYGLGTLFLLGKLMAAFYVTCLIFIFVVLGRPP
jgi:hypothetical protein